MHIVILAAGRGSRFNGSEFVKPKPLIEWDGKTMTEHVIDNFKNPNTEITVIKRDWHEIKDDGVRLISIDYTTEGPASTAYLAKQHINMDDELVIVNCDQIIIDWNQNNFLNFSRNYDGVLGCFISNKNKNSYVKIDDNNLVIDVKEKEVISNIATNGLHYWRKALYFYESYEQMFRNKDKTNNEYYVAPSYNYMIKKNMKVGIFMFNQHFPIGTPEDLREYLKLKETLI